MKTGTVALIVTIPGGPASEARGDDEPKLVEALSDDQEIQALGQAIESQATQPLQCVHELREKMSREDEEFANYVEELLTQPFVRPEVQEHGIQWLKSKIRIEQFQKSETEAMQVIAGYAFKLYLQDRKKTDFLLASTAAQVRIRVFAVPDEAQKLPQSNAA